MPLPTYGDLRRDLDRVRQGVDRDYRSDPEHDQARLAAVERTLLTILSKLAQTEA